MDSTPFEGFTRPQENFYRLPNDWFDLLAQVRSAIGRVSIVGLIRLLEYIIKHTWGVGNFERPIRLSLNELQKGRVTGRANGKRLRADRGTGLDRTTLVNAIQQAEALGLIERISLGGDAARRQFAYRLRIAPADEEDAPGETLLHGFPNPHSNYFIVPKAWTDLTSRQRSDALILAVEYLVRHAWGWRSRKDEIHWLSADEVAAGRRYRSPRAGGEEERYDSGIGYSFDKTYHALEKGVEMGLLVWREGQTGGGIPVRVYTLRRLGWPAGQWQDEEAEDEEPEINLSLPPVTLSLPPDNLSLPEDNVSQSYSNLTLPRSVIPTLTTINDLPTQETPPAPPTPPPEELTVGNPRAGGGGYSHNNKEDGLRDQHTLTLFPNGYDGPRVEVSGKRWSNGEALAPDRVLVQGEAPDEPLITVDLTTAALLLVRGVSAAYLGWSAHWWEQPEDGDGPDSHLPPDGWEDEDEAEAERRRNVVEGLRAVLQTNLRDWGHWDLQTALAEIEEMGQDAAAELLRQYDPRIVGGHLAALRAQRARHPASVKNLPGLLCWKLARGQRPPRRRPLDD